MNNQNIVKKAKNISKDFIYNITASLLFTGVMQIIVYPYLAQRFSAQEYGTLLTLMGIANTVVVSLGNTLNNTRLIMNQAYEKKHLSGDFNIILIFAVFVSVVCTIIAGTFVFDQGIFATVLLSLYVGLACFRAYVSVEFRLVLNFKKILYGNVWGALGYIVGTGIVMVIPVWSISFLMAELFYTLYILHNTKIYRESYKTTELLGRTSSKYLILIITGLSGNLLVYLDRLLIYPLVGADAVSTYTVAAFFGKTLSIVMVPIAGVLLGYYAQKDYKMTIKKFWNINILTLVFCSLFILISIVLSPLITKLLYPTLFESAKSYLFVANLAATIGVMCSITQTSVLKFAPTWLQIVKEVVYGVAYIGCGVVLLDRYGLWGFCMAAVTANVVKLLTLYIMGTLFIGKEERM